MSNSNSSKQILLSVIGIAILIISVVVVAFAFFNYTRTGASNTIKTGRIAFNTNQTNTLTLTNVFPVEASSVGNDYTEDTLTISVTGDTTYGEGLEYLVTAEEVNVETNTGKKVPLTLKVDVTDNLGTEDSEEDEIEYYTNRGGNTSYYKILSESVLYDGQYLLVGYIAPGTEGINGTINIKAYLDKNRVAISDTYPKEDIDTNNDEVIDYTNETNSNWVNGRVVLTTNEWNSLQTSGNELSFKVRIESNEGAWVDPETNQNAVGRLNSTLTNGVTEIHFIKETPIRMERRYNATSVKADITDTTLNEGKVLAWQEGTILYVASSGETYLPANSADYFEGLSNVTKIVFENINSSRVTSLAGFLSGCSSLTDISLNGWGSNNLIDVSSMFGSCTNLTNINMAGFNFGTASMNNLFSNLSNLETIDLSNANTSNVGNMSGLFLNCTGLESVDVSSLDTSNVTNMGSMFLGCSSLTSIDLSGLGSDNLTTISNILEDCTNLREINMSNFNFGQVTNIESLFTQANTLIEKINLSNANTSSFTSLNYTFDGLSSLTILDLTNIDTSNVVSMQATFRNCQELEELDISSFDTSNVNDITNIFTGCSNLRKIYVSNTWDISGTSIDENTFYGCSSIVGGNGTIYDSSKISSIMAIIDGTNNDHGYLTDIIDKPTN